MPIVLLDGLRRRRQLVHPPRVTMGVGVVGVVAAEARAEEVVHHTLLRQAGRLRLRLKVWEDRPVQVGDVGAARATLDTSSWACRCGGFKSRS